MSRKLNKLTTEDLEHILGEWEDSEDGLDFSDDDDAIDPTYKFKPNEHESSDEELENYFQSNSIYLTNLINGDSSCLLYVVYLGTVINLKFIVVKKIGAQLMSRT